MSIFGELLDQDYNDSPEFFYTTYECKMLGDKVKQRDLEPVETEELKRVKFIRMNRSERRRRTIRHKKHLLNLNKLPYLERGVREVVSNGDVVTVVRTRPKHSSKISKQICNRRFRRSGRLNLFVSSSRNIQHKATELWR